MGIVQKEHFAVRRPNGKILVAVSAHSPQNVPSDSCQLRAVVDFSIRDRKLRKNPSDPRELGQHSPVEAESYPRASRVSSSPVKSAKLPVSPVTAAPSSIQSDSAIVASENRFPAPSREEIAFQ